MVFALCLGKPRDKRVGSLLSGEAGGGYKAHEVCLKVLYGFGKPRGKREGSLMSGEVQGQEQRSVWGSPGAREKVL